MKPIDLIEHPEGGSYKEVYRSARMVSKSDGTEGPALTHIYFSLTAQQISMFHKVTSDEVWNLYQGEGVNLFLWNGTDTAPQCVTLSARENCFCYVVPPGVWQAAAPISDTILVGCSVAPGVSRQLLCPVRVNYLGRFFFQPALHALVHNALNPGGLGAGPHIKSGKIPFCFNCRQPDKIIVTQ